MTVESIVAISGTVITIIVAPFIYIWKTMTARIDKLEEQLDRTLDKDSVRLLISDKIEPVQQDLAEIKSLIHKIIEIQLKKDN